MSLCRQVSCGARIASWAAAIKPQALRLSAFVGAFAAVVVLCCACVTAEPTPALAFRDAPVAKGFVQPQRIVDGRVPREGSPYDHALAAIAREPGSFVQLDLGEPRRVRAVWLQADHDDGYAVQASLDGRRYDAVWEAEPVDPGGLRERFSDGVDVRARYVRVVGRGGDGVYSVSEVRLYGERPALWPPAVERWEPEAPGSGVRWRLWAFGVAAALFLVALRWIRRRWGIALAGLPVVVGGVLAVHGAVVAAPIDVVTESTVRAVCGLIGAAAAFALASVRGARRRLIPLGLLASAAVVAAASYFHFGRAQFHDLQRDESSQVHGFDMRIYFPVAKYFDELSFDGVYVATLRALEERDDRITAEILADVPLRDLRTHRVVRYRDVRDHSDAVRRRFSQRRWNMFVRDMRYFDESIGLDGILASVLDHGGNATPLWIANAHLLFSPFKANKALLELTALLDPLLLGLMILAVARAFGLVAALMVVLVFGACDYHMGGNTNWVGATLRYDWLAALGMSVAAMKVRRPALGGALLALSGFLRAFPAFGFFGVAAAFGWWVRDTRVREGRWPGLRRISKTPASKVIAGGAATSVILFAYTLLVLPVDAWPAWLHKVRLLSSSPAANHMGLATLFSYAPAASLRAIEERGLTLDWRIAEATAFEHWRAFYYSAAVGMSLLILWACRRQPLHRAALIGLTSFLVWLYPANYYLHFICLLPLLADLRRDPRVRISGQAAFVWIVLGALCTAQYAAVVQPYLDMHYLISTALTFAALIVILGVVGTLPAISERDPARSAHP